MLPSPPSQSVPGRFASVNAALALASKAVVSAESSTIARLQADVEKLRKLASSLQSTNVSLSKDLATATAETASAERALKRLDNTRDAAREQAEQRSSEAEAELARCAKQVKALKRIGHADTQNQLRMLNSRIADAEAAQQAAAEARDEATKRAATLNTENIRLRAQLKRTEKASTEASAAAERSAAELQSYQQDMSERVAGDGENWARSSAASMQQLLAFEVRRSATERKILVEELTSRFDMPEERLYDSSTGEFKGRMRLVCIGSVKRGVAAKRLQDLLLFLANELFFVNMPVYSRRNRKTKVAQQLWRLPSTTAIERFAGEGNVLCDMKLVTAMTRNARNAAAGGGDAVFDNRVGALVDGADSKGDSFQGLVVDMEDGESVTGGMVATVSGTSAAKAQTGADLYGRWHQLAERMAQSPAFPELTMSDAENVTILNCAVLSTDRCAAEAGQVKELQALKTEELPLFLGNRFLRVRHGVSLRLMAQGAECCAVQLHVWLQDAEAKQGVESFITESQIISQLSDAMNMLLATRPSNPLTFLGAKLGSPTETARAAAALRRGGANGSEFSDAVEQYLWKHKVTALVEAAVNRLAEDPPDLYTTSFGDAFAAAADEDPDRPFRWASTDPDTEDLDDGEELLPIVEPPVGEGDELARGIGDWLLAGLPTRRQQLLVLIAWTNCHEHALVNTFEAMGDAAMEDVVSHIGQPRLCELASIQSGKTYSAETKKFRTGVWLMDKPVMHGIYRFCIYLAPQSSKDWAKGKRFIEYVIEKGELKSCERWVLEGLMAIRGSRNGVFWANAVAMVIWRERAIAFLKHEQALADAKNEKEGGCTRRYLLAWLQEDEVVACLHAMALLYLQLYLPFMSSITHVEDVADELSALDQSVYTSLVAASDETASDELVSGACARLLRPQYDRVKAKTRDLRVRIRSLISDLPSASGARVRPLISKMLTAGARSFHHHTVERQSEQHDAAKPDKRLGASLNLNAEHKAKLRAGRALTHAQERMFGNLRLEHDRAQTLLHDHLEGRVRVRMDDPDDWLFGLVASGGMTEEQLDQFVRFAAAEARRRAKQIGGRLGQYRTLGRKRAVLEKAILEKAAEKQRKLDEELARLQALRVDHCKALEKLLSDALLDQIRVFKLVDKVDVKLSEASGKLTRMMLLAELLVKKYGSGVKDPPSDEELRTWAGLKGKGSQRAGKRKKAWAVDAVIGARMGKKDREYLVRWEMEIEEGEKWETWEPYSELMIQAPDGTMEIHEEIDKQVAATHETTRPPLTTQVTLLCVACDSGGRAGHAHGRRGARPYRARPGDPRG
jgi:hypothetical protein